MSDVSRHRRTDKVSRLLNPTFRFACAGQYRTLRCQSPAQSAAQIVRKFWIPFVKSLELAIATASAQRHETIGPFFRRATHALNIDAPTSYQARPIKNAPIGRHYTYWNNVMSNSVSPSAHKKCKTCSGCAFPSNNSSVWVNSIVMQDKHCFAE